MLKLGVHFAGGYGLDAFIPPHDDEGRWVGGWYVDTHTRYVDSTAGSVSPCSVSPCSASREARTPFSSYLSM